MSHNLFNSGASELQLSFSAQAFGNLKVKYSLDESYIYPSTSVAINLDGEESEFSVDESLSSYKVVSCTKDTLFLRFNSEEHGSYENTFHFEGANVYWVSSEYAPELREYFVRISE